MLLVLSNDRSLRWLKGKKWKRVQQWTYPLIVLTIIHTLGYQLYNERDGLLLGALATLTLIVVMVQGAGVIVHRRRESMRVPAPARPRAAGEVTPTLVPWQPSTEDSSPGTLSRRRFLVLGGATLLAGIAAISFKVTEEVMGSTGSGPAPYRPQANNLPAADNTAVPSPTAVAVDDKPAAPQPTAPSSDDNANNGANTPSPTSPAVAENSPAPADPGTEANSGVVLTTLAACPANSAVTFIAPDTGEPGILVHEADGTVNAFSNNCTHKPYPLQYDANSQLLVCPLHWACFNAKSGRVTQGPARRALASMPVHVDSQGNVIYG